MGLNVNLVRMLGVPERVRCPNCGNEVKTDFDDYDIECGNPNPGPATWELAVDCPICERRFNVSFEVYLHALEIVSD